MRSIRLYYPGTIELEREFELHDSGAAHLLRVLKAKQGQTLTLFNGDGFSYQGHLTRIHKKSAFVTIDSRQKVDNESPVRIHLGQVVSRGDKMDFTLQKAVELGVSSITPLISQRCGVKLSSDRWQKKVEHWQKVVHSACEQCGRNRIPPVQSPLTLEKWCQWQDTIPGLILDCNDHTSSSWPAELHEVRLIVGSEGGLTEEEVQYSRNHNFTALQLGPRILRTETAALTLIAILQHRYGDFL